MDNEQLKSNLTSSRHWLRLVFMVFFAAVLYVASLVMWLLVAVQFIFSLITGEDNSHLRRFGHSLSTYIYDVLKFLCYSSDDKPFPFADWPATYVVIVEPEVVTQPESVQVKHIPGAPTENAD